MNSWNVTAPDGRKLKVTGEVPPSPDELDEIFGLARGPSVSSPAPAATAAPKSTALGAFGSHAARSVLPTAGALGAGALAATALTPFTGGLSWLPILAGIGAGFGGGALTHMAQEKGLEKLAPQFKSGLDEKMARQREEHPYASLSGELIPAAAAFRPSVSGTANAVGALRKLMSGAGRTITPVEGEALLASGLGTAVGGAAATVPPLMRGEELDPLKVLMETAAGTTFNKPTALGRKLNQFGIRYEEPSPSPTAEGIVRPPAAPPTPQAEGAPLPSRGGPEIAGPTRPEDYEMDLPSGRGSVVPAEAGPVPKARQITEAQAAPVVEKAPFDQAGYDGGQAKKVVDANEAYWDKWLQQWDAGVRWSDADFQERVVNEIRRRKGEARPTGTGKPLAEATPRTEATTGTTPIAPLASPQVVGAAPEQVRPAAPARPIVPKEEPRRPGFVKGQLPEPKLPPQPTPLPDLEGVPYETGPSKVTRAKPFVTPPETAPLPKTKIGEARVAPTPAVEPPKVIPKMGLPPEAPVPAAPRRAVRHKGSGRVYHDESHARALMQAQDEGVKTEELELGTFDQATGKFEPEGTSEERIKSTSRVAEAERKVKGKDSIVQLGEKAKNVAAKDMLETGEGTGAVQRMREEVDEHLGEISQKVKDGTMSREAAIARIAQLVTKHTGMPLEEILPQLRKAMGKTKTPPEFLAGEQPRREDAGGKGPARPYGPSTPGVSSAEAAAKIKKRLKKEGGFVDGSIAEDLAVLVRSALARGASSLERVYAYVRSMVGEGWEKLKDEIRRLFEDETGAISLSGPSAVKDAPFGGSQDVKISGKALFRWVKTNQHLINPEEYDVNALQKFLAEPRTKNELARWFEETGPKVEVRELSASKSASKEDIEFANAQHELDTYGLVYSGNEIYRRGRAPADVGNAAVSIPDNRLDVQELIAVRAFRQARQKALNIPANESATARYQMVNPKPLSEMPGAVDLLVRVPVETPAMIEGKYGKSLPPGAVMSSNRPGVAERVKYTSSHYPTEGKNLVAHVRGYMETIPDGRKVFHVFEIQSDWAQAKRERDQEFAQWRERTGRVPAGEKKLDDPLLPHYERLALKAAIEHARKNGADAIAVADYPTTALTEGWDRIQKRAQDAAKRANDDLPAKLPSKLADWMDEYSQYGAKAHIEGDAIVIDTLPFEGGGRLHYDRTLPDIAAKLTGEPGERVSFGEHQNAVERRIDMPQQGVEYNLDDLKNKHPRKDLIFRNPDGTPKTDITARLFPIGKARKEFSILGKDKALPIAAAERVKKNLSEGGFVNADVLGDIGTIVRDAFAKGAKTLGEVFQHVKRLVGTGWEKFKDEIRRLFEDETGAAGGLDPKFRAEQKAKIEQVRAKGPVIPKAVDQYYRSIPDMFQSDPKLGPLTEEVRQANLKKDFDSQEQRLQIRNFLRTTRPEHLERAVKAMDDVATGRDLEAVNKLPAELKRTVLQHDIFMEKRRAEIVQFKKDELLDMLEPRHANVVRRVLAGEDMETAIGSTKLREHGRSEVRQAVEELGEIEKWGFDKFVTKIEPGGYHAVGYKTVDGVEQPVRINLANATTRTGATAKLHEVLSDLKAKGELDSFDHFEISNEFDPKGSYRKELVADVAEDLGTTASKLQSALRERGFHLDIRPSRKFAGTFEHRRGILKGETKDYQAALEEYADSVARKINMDPALRKLKNAIENPRTSKEDKEVLEAWMKDLRGKYSFADRLVDGAMEYIAANLEKATGVPVGFKQFAASRFLSHARDVMANAVFFYRPAAGAFNLAGGQMLTWVKTGSKLYGRALKDWGSADEAKLWEKNKYRTGIRASLTGTKADDLRELIKPTGLFSLAELPNRRVTFRASYLQALKKGLSGESAEDYAAAQTLFIQTSYDMASVPRGWRGPVTKTALQFKWYMAHHVEFLRSLSGAEWARYAVGSAALGGPIAAFYAIKSLPFVGEDAEWVRDAEEALNKTPGARGIPGIAGLDVTPSVAFQMPTDVEGWAGPFFGQMLKAWKTFVAPAQRGEKTSERKELSYVKNFSPMVNYWWMLTESLANEQGIVTDNRGRVRYEPSKADQTKLALGARPLRMAQQSLETQFVRQSALVEKANRQVTVDDYLDAISSGDVEAAAKIAREEFPKYGVTAQGILEIAKARRLPANVRQVMASPRSMKPLAASKLLGSNSVFRAEEEQPSD